MIASYRFDYDRTVSDVTAFKFHPTTGKSEFILTAKCEVVSFQYNPYESDFAKVVLRCLGDQCPFKRVTLTLEMDESLKSTSLEVREVKIDDDKLITYPEMCAGLGYVYQDECTSPKDVTRAVDTRPTSTSSTASASV